MAAMSQTFENHDEQKEHTIIPIVSLFITHNRRLLYSPEKGHAG
jgi:hypothetical protein